MFMRVIAVLCSWILTTALGSIALASDPPRPPNVVLIISDDHGYRDYGFMGSRDVRTPNLDRLAAQSLTFRRGTVPSSLCCPSLASLVTGRYPHQHKITSNDPPIPAGMGQAEFHRSSAFKDGRERMNRHLEAVPTLPRSLQAQNYLSLQTGKWWLGDFKRGGFTDGMTRGQRHGDEGLEIGRKTMKPIADFVARSKSERRPFFVWYAPMLPHSPHNPPERLLSKYRKPGESIHVARYRAMVEWFDETCGDLLKILDESGEADNTIVVYLADNGWNQNPDDPGSFRSKLTPYDDGLRTPILIRWPSHISLKVSDLPVSSVDIAPTLLKATGSKPDPGMPGIDLLDERGLRDRGMVYGECHSHNAVDLDRPSRNLLWRWINDGRWKLIVPSEVARDRAVELYDIQGDPGELKDVAREHPEIVEKLTSRLDLWWKPDR